jgi:hypothetical protein
VIRADGPNQIHLRRAAHASDLRCEHVGELHRECAHTSGRTNDQHRLPRLDLSLVAKTLESRARRDGNRRRLLEGKGCRLERNLVGTSARVLSEGTVAGAEDLITRLKRRYILADRLDASGDIAPNAGLGFAQPEAHDSHQVRQASHEMPHTGIDASRVNAYQHLVVLNDWGIDVLELEDIGPAVLVLDDRLHGNP